MGYTAHLEEQSGHMRLNYTITGAGPARQLERRGFPPVSHRLHLGRDTPVAPSRVPYRHLDGRLAESAGASEPLSSVSPSNVAGSTFGGP
jgi:hypothetical protein